MAIKYAIKYKTPDEERIRDSRNIITNHYTYVDVPKETAESDWDSGVSAVFTNSGKRVSSWTKLHNPLRDEEISKAKPNTPLADCLGSMLAIGDYVLTSFGDSHGQILCRVIGFTAKFVKIHNLSTSKVIARDPALLVRVEQSMISD
jgi:hypothetical protein